MIRRTPAQLEIPTLLICAPFTLDNKNANNELMSETDRKVNRDRAFSQFLSFYKELTKEFLVYILPTESDFQDISFTANICVFLPHWRESDLIILSNYKSPPRKGEELVANKFLSSMEYQCVRSPHHIEGEADLRYIRKDLYVGGYGIRTDIRTYSWLNEKYGVNIVPVKMTDPKLYHFDCIFCRLSPNKALVATQVLQPQDIKNIERFIEIIDIPKKYVYNGWTNILVNKNTVYHDQFAGQARRDCDEFFNKLGFNPIAINLSEFALNGASLSCNVCHLNWV